ncbi:MAG: SIR2 family protein [Anaerolineae bacterium]|nr:SIR2 family protein [Anaerolineae bacterium]
MLTENVPWDFIVEQIDKKQCTPIISNHVVNDLLFGEPRLISAWADRVRYPLADSANLTRVAQFHSVTLQDSIRAKSEYLAFLEYELLDLAERDPKADQNFLRQVRRERRSLTFSQLATERLHYPNFKDDPQHPLTILANFDIPVYLTTSHHRFMEAALKAVGKTPHTEVYCWREDLEENIPAACKPDLNFEPDERSPLVYHLHGLDDYADSLVLTEDDHLEFLVNVTRDFSRADVFPRKVRNAFTSSLLMLIGYELQGWDLRVLLQGLIRGKRHQKGIAVQLEHSQLSNVKHPQQFQEYLQNFFGLVKFDVYWGSPQNFLTTLWQAWNNI